jgi:hypothetical protein
MSFAEIFWALSTAGAALFFVSGVAAATARHARLAAAGAAPALLALPPPAVELAPLAERDAWELERTVLLAERDELAERVSDLRTQQALLEENAKRSASQSAAELARLRNRLEASDRERRERSGVLSPRGARGPHATSFQGILDRFGTAGGVRSAVLGDALGLPIASLGEHPDSLAGFCGFLAQAATRACDFLPIVRVRRIILEDDRGTTLAACSIDHSEIFLATLTSGPAPELRRMVQVLHDAESFFAERSRA